MASDNNDLFISHDAAAGLGLTGLDGCCCRQGSLGRLPAGGHTAVAGGGAGLSGRLGASPGRPGQRSRPLPPRAFLHTAVVSGCHSQCVQWHFTLTMWCNHLSSSQMSSSPQEETSDSLSGHPDSCPPPAAGSHSLAFRPSRFAHSGYFV